MKHIQGAWAGLIALLLTGMLLSGCDVPIDQFWKEPRDLLVDRVEAARDAQQTSVEQIQTAMEKFKHVTQFEGGNLEKEFNTLNSAFKRSQSAVEDVSTRIDRVQSATDKLFDEWSQELEKYHDPSLRAKSEQELEATRQRAARMIAAMRRAEAKTKPVLNVFRDQVLFLKHNLNMQAITSLRGETAKIETDVSRLIDEMKASIAEANRFIDAMHLSS